MKASCAYERLQAGLRDNFQSERSGIGSKSLKMLSFEQEHQYVAINFCALATKEMYFVLQQSRTKKKKHSKGKKYVMRSANKSEKEEKSYFMGSWLIQPLHALSMDTAKRSSLYCELHQFMCQHRSKREGK